MTYNNETQITYAQFLDFPNLKRMCIGTSNGFLIFETKEQRFSPFTPWTLAKNSFIGGCSVVCCNSNKMVITAGLGETDQENSPRLSKIYKVDNLNDTLEIARFSFEIPILKIHVVDKFLIFVLEIEIHIYDVTNLSFVTKITTSLNPKGVFGFSSSNILAFPKLKVGKSMACIALYDLNIRQEKREILTSHTALECIQFNLDGSLISTAPEDGVLIKVYSVLDGAEKYVFRRATLNSAQICSMIFDRSSSLLAVATSKGTVHIFDLKEGQLKAVPSIADTGLYASTSSFVEEKTVGKEARSFNVVRLTSVSSVLAFSLDSKKIITLGYDGMVQCWEINKTKLVNFIGQEKAADCIKDPEDMNVLTYIDF
jgi:WD40 repeat protein